MIDLSGSDLIRAINDKQRQYKALLVQAQRQNRMNGGAVSKEEARLYRDAADVCGEIMNMNLSQRDVYAQWQMRKEECDAKVEAIIEELNPGYLQACAKADPEKPTVSVAAADNPTVKAAAVASPKASVAEPKKTESGFKTKNACKDVTAATIEKFYKPKPNHNLSNVTGMEEQISMLRDEIDTIGFEMTDEALSIDSIHGYLFYGPPGSGKTYLIEGFASELMEQQGFKYIKLLGSDIKASLVGVGEKTVQIAIQEAIDNSPCILFIDEIDGVCEDRNDPNTNANQKSLTNAFLEAWNTLCDQGKNIVLIGATNYPGNVDSAMVDRLKLTRVPLPSEEERIAYFADKFKHLNVEEGFSFEAMAQATSNSSYRDLDRLSKAISMKIKSAVVQQNRVNDAAGRMDVKETDQAASREILQGQVEISKELFEEKLKQNPPSDKSAIRESLRKFEERDSDNA